MGLKICFLELILHTAGSRKTPQCPLHSHPGVWGQPHVPLPSMQLSGLPSLGHKRCRRVLTHSVLALSLPTKPLPSPSSIHPTDTTSLSHGAETLQEAEQTDSKPLCSALSSPHFSQGTPMPQRFHQLAEPPKESLCPAPRPTGTASHSTAIAPPAAELSVTTTDVARYQHLVSLQMCGAEPTWSAQ